MNFINQYADQGINGSYKYAEEFSEDDNQTIYSVGQRPNGGPVKPTQKALITKTDGTGEIVWEKYYQFSGATPDIRFEKIIRLQNLGEDGGGIGIDPGGIRYDALDGGIVKPKLSVQYVLYATDDRGYWILSINNKGDELWCFQLPFTDSLNIFLEPSVTDGGFYVVSSAPDYGSGILPTISTFDSTGHIQGSNQLGYKDHDMLVRVVHSVNHKIILGCIYFAEDEEDGPLRSCAFQFGGALSFIEFVIFGLSLDMHDIWLSPSDDYLLTAKWGDYQDLYVADFSMGTQVVFMIPADTDYYTKLCLLDDNQYYLLQYNDGENIIHKIAYGSFDIEWSKSLLVYPDVNGLSYLTHNPDSGNLTFTDLPSDGSDTSVIYADENLNSCKTVDAPVPVILYDSKYESWTEEPDIARISIRPETTVVTVLGTKVEKDPICGGDDGDTIDYDENTKLQSPALVLQAAGSTGADGSVTGIHLRWIFGGGLGEKHLPKANYATTNYYFNKPDDFVKIYRTPYYKVTTQLDLSAAPYLVDDGNKVWMYRVNDKVFYVYFRNTAKYTIVRAANDPLSNPLTFITAYGNELIEIENKRELFFAAELRIAVPSGVTTGSIKTETLSVSENALAVPKTVSSRMTYGTADLGNIHLFCDNGRSIRYKTTGCVVTKIYFEFYSDFIISANARMAWHYIDQYALTNDDTVAFARLNPDAIDAKWPRFNDHECVNAENYEDRWNGPREVWDRNIARIVKEYIELSDGPDNPTAIEEVPLESEAPDGDDVLEVSNLDLLNIAAYDYHIARILGLGTLDMAQTAMTGKFIYVSQYYTKEDLQNGGGDRLINLVSMSLPTSTFDERLPLAVDLKELRPGAFFGTDSPDPVNLTDVDGYSFDGTSRYITIYSEPLPADDVNMPFYITTREFITANFTYPVYAGIEYKKNDEQVWEKPELPHYLQYQNKTDTGDPGSDETMSLLIPEDQNPLFVHQERVSGTHYYSSYGVNWFSRSLLSHVILSIETLIKPANGLKPPINIAALLIREEQPLILTSPEDQDRFSHTTGSSDRTLIRMNFDYHTFQELIDYKIPDGGDPNDPDTIPAVATELYAKEVEIFFRNQVPGNVSGKALSIDDDPGNPILSFVETGSYTESSTGTVLQPIIGAGQVANYIGGVFIIGDQQYIIHAIDLPTGSMTGPRFTLYKHEISSGIITNEIPDPGAVTESPVIIPDGLFMAVENMQNPVSWGTPNPLPLKVNIGESDPVAWQWHRENIVINSNGTTENHVEKSRGIWDSANIEAIEEPVAGGMEHRGMYKLSFLNKVLDHHSQYVQYSESVEWSGGIVRIHSVGSPLETRRVLKVIKIDNIGSTDKLIVYAYDETFMTDDSSNHIPTGTTDVNFYPGYKVHLYADNAYGLTYPNILPAPGEGMHYSIFGLRSHDVNDNLYSKISVPQLMFAQEQIEALPPLAPQGSLYATRPDFFGRSTYTFKTKYSHKPNGVLYYRSNDELLLNSLYKSDTVVVIRENLKALGGNEEEFLTNRWHNFLDFTLLGSNHDYLSFPPVDPQNPQLSYKFPNPDNQAFFDWANHMLDNMSLPHISGAPGTITAGDPQIVNFVIGAIYNAFVPLTAIPILYDYINGGTYKPVNKKQTVRDRNGNVLQPGSADFDMAPMMKVTGQPGNETIFADFTLDGTSNNLYFYGAKELDTQMKMSDFSPFLGPIKLVNTNPPETPQIKRIMPVLGNIATGILPAIQFELNAYPAVQNIKKVNLYRSFNALDAQSVQLMTLIKIVDLETAGIVNDSVWQFTDDFSDQPEVPYGDGLYYRLTVSRKVEYDDKDGNVITEYAPSQPSKITATLIVENYNPPAPVLSYTADAPDAQGNIDNVTLLWDKSAYKAKYHIYKMNNSGNWVELGVFPSNLPHLVIPLDNTDWGSNILPTKDADGNNIYSHFKVVSENTSGMLSLEENILTIPS